MGVEIAPGRVSAVHLARRRSQFVVLKHASERLPEGAVAPQLTATNLPDPEAVAEVLKRVLQSLGVRSKRVGLVVPDSLAKVSLVRFEKVPMRVDDLDQLVRWQVRKTAPFKIEDAQVTYSPGIVPPEGGREFIVTLARRDIVQEYERVCASAGVHAGVVDLASFSVINLVLAGSSSGRSSSSGDDAQEGSRDAMTTAIERARSGYSIGDWLVVHVTPQYSSVAIVRGEDLVFFRNRRAEVEGNLADLVHQTTMYYEDRLSGSGFSRIVLAGAAASASGSGPEEAEQLKRSLEARLKVPVEIVDPTLAAAFRGAGETGAEVLDVMAPPVGLLLREQVRA